MNLRRVNHKTTIAIVMVLAMLGSISAACSTPVGVAPTGQTFRMGANKVTVVHHNDTFLYGQRDEPFVINLWFRVKVGEPNSAQVGITGSRDVAINDLGDGESRALAANQQGTVDFPNVKLLDVGDLLNPANKLEVVGSWTWAMERDDIGISGAEQNILNVVKNALNVIVASGNIPQDPNVLVPALLGNFGQAFNLIASALFASIPGLPDDAVGSRFYIGVGATGALSNIIDATVGTTPFPTVAIPVVTVPPDITGGSIFSLGHNNSFTGQVFEGNGRHDYDLSMVNVATIPKPPVASFTTSATSGSVPLTVSLDGSGSSDPDGTVSTYSWSFGDFATGSGPTASHTFTTSGTFPVTLTVTDDSGMSSSTTKNISVGGAPTVAPTGLTKTGSGCCNTYGDFAWNMVPGATAYEIHMGSYFGGGCLVDASAVIPGQVPTGRVQDGLLCLGSHYNVKIRAQANGQWGPWSPTTNFGL